MDTRATFGWLLVAVLAVLTWLLAQPFLGWLLATGLLAFALHPLHRRFEPRIGARRSAGLLTVAVVLVVVIPLAAGVYALANRGADLLLVVSDTTVLEPLQRTLTETTGYTVPLQSYAEQAADQLTTYVSERPSALLGQGLHAFLGFLLLTFVLYYLLKDGHELLGWVKRSTPLAPAVREQLFESTDEIMWAVLKGHVLVAMVQGAVAGVSLVITGVPNPFLLTVAMMVLALVPVIGVAPVLGGAVVYLLVEGRPLASLLVVVWGMTSVAVTDDYLRAYLIDQQSDVHSALIFVGILGGTYLLGAIGLFVGPIIVGVFKTTVEVLGDAYGVTQKAGV
jgi:predicted PurR-regulated permease PerM